MLEQISFNLWYYKLQNETHIINKMRKRNQIIPPVIAMKELSCFGSSKLSLSLLDAVLDEKWKMSSETKHMCYI